MIHYHGMPLSGRDLTAVKCMQGKHAMVSFADTQPLATVAELCQSFTLDNGAFTTWKTGKEYDIKGFAELVKEYYRHPGMDWYIIPDSIDGADAENNAIRAEWRNLVSHEIYRMGVPVWHLHESLKTLNYLSRTYQRIAFGSSGQFAQVGTSGWWTRMAEAMNTVCDNGRPRCKLHGLRMLDPTIFSQFPLASADSTNVSRNAGLCSKWHGTYAPKSKHTRALIMMERIESHASAAQWNNESRGVQQNMELLG